MKIKMIYIFILYNILISSSNAEISYKNNNSNGNISIESINRKIEIKKEQLVKLEQLKKYILIKKMKKKDIKIGLALSGGGTKGFAHIGVLKVLEENNIHIDYISGTSMGGIIAALYAIGYSPDEITKVITNMNWKYRLSNNPRRDDIPFEEKMKNRKYFTSIIFDNKFNFSLPKGLLTGEKSYLKLKDLFWSVKGIQNFNDFSPKLRIIATNFSTGEVKTFDHGDLSLIVSASMAIPTIYEPVQVNKGIYIDGMASRNLPVEDLFKAGADIVIASDVGAPINKTSAYNLLTVLENVTSYREVESTKKQRKLANIVIDPDVKTEGATDFNNSLDLIKKGAIAANKKLKQLKQYSNYSLKKHKPKKIVSKYIYIDNVQINNSKIIDKNMIISILDKKIPGNFDQSDLENLMMKLYALPYIEKSYYTVIGNTLQIDIIEKKLNRIRLGGNYNSDIGAKIAFGIDFRTIGTFLGSITSLEAELGSYNTIFFSTYWYYGRENKIGINIKSGYEELPIFIYNNKHLKTKLTSQNKYIDLSISTKLIKKIDFSTGLKYSKMHNKYIDGEDHFDNDSYKNYADEALYFKLIFDKKNSSSYPSKGLYSYGYIETGGIANDNIEYYSESGIIKSYIPVTKKLSINASFSGGLVDGGYIPINKYFKIGGIYNDLKNNYISFYGYNTMRKLVSKFAIFQLGIQYKLYPNLYLSAKANAINYNENYNFNSDLSKSDLTFGYGISLGYSSFLGPLDFSITNDSDYKNGVILSISLGYFF